MKDWLEQYPYAEELANALTHGIGATVFLVLCPLLIAFAVQTNSKRKIVGACLFAFGILSVYLSSTIFHAVPDRITKDVLRFLDLISIYLLIAGSYTAYILIYFRSRTWNILLILIWVVSLFGIFFKLIFPNASIVYSLVLYLILGWTGIIMVRPSLRRVKPSVLLILVLGGISYTAGTPFFYFDAKNSFYHSIWHLFVFGGSLSHWVAILFAVQNDNLK